MTGTESALALAASFAGTSLLALGLRAVLLRRAILDIPNERSSHQVPVPRGGGIAFVVPCVAGLAAATLAGSGAEGSLAAATGIAGVGAVGLVDDIRGVRPSVRLAVHLACGTLATWTAAAMLAGTLGVPAVALAVSLSLAAAWFVNMVNFMDGIDGIAGAEGAFVLGAAGALAVAGTDGASPPVARCALLCAASVAGFTAVNMSRLRIFMGDCGSGALGLLVAWLLATAVASGALSPWSALALPAAFTADAGVTLARRLAAGKSPIAAHRTHAYQRLVRRGAGHRAVTLGYAAINLAVVLPVAWMAGKAPAPVAAAMVAGLHAALGTAAFALGAGREPAEAHAA
jgi:Fuc2NAc and GlcNAc transferase